MNFIKKNIPFDIIAFKSSLPTHPFIYLFAFYSCIAINILELIQSQSFQIIFQDRLQFFLAEQLTSIALLSPFSCQSADEVFAHRQTLIPEVSPRFDMTESDVKPESATSLKEKAPNQPGTTCILFRMLA